MLKLAYFIKLLWGNVLCFGSPNLGCLFLNNVKINCNFTAI